ncbi:MAG: HAD-IC family P-type ATPase, partial [Pseudonocardia sediminis]
MSDAELLAHAPGLDRAHASTADAAVSALGTDSTRGLTGADAASRLTTTGANRFRTPRRVTFRHVLADEITEPMMLLLVAVAVLYSVWGRLEDTIAIVVIISAVVLVEVFAEYRAKTVIAALGKLTAPTAPVLRDGRTEQVPTEDLVPGDVIPLRAGARVPADVRLVGTWGLRVDESALTGESVAVGKDADDVLPDDTDLAERTNLAFAGTTVAAGRARGVVVATGMATELGRITGLVLEAKPPRTALQQAMRDLSRVLAMVAIGFSVLVPLIGIIGGQPWREMVLTGLTMAFATVPEELPIIISLVLGLGAYRLSRRNGLVRRLRAAEALGTVTTIATDKTGTLTENRMAVTSLAADAIPDDRLLALGAACHDATTEGTEFAGDPTDVAFLEAARDRDLLPGTPGGVFGDVVARFAFDAHRESMTVVHTRDDGRFLLITKGAPEALLERCAARGGHRALGADDRAELTARAERMAADGLRVIAVATRVLATVPASVQDAEEHLTFAGLVGLEDPPRAEVPEAMAAARRAGIRVLMVTGDHPACARAIAAQIGLDGDGPLLTGHELDRLDDA